MEPCGSFNFSITNKSFYIYGILYPIEIKKGSNPTASDADAFTVLDKDIDKKRGIGAIICTGEYKLKLRENLYSLPIEYIYNLVYGEKEL